MRGGWRDEEPISNSHCAEDKGVGYELQADLPGKLVFMEEQWKGRKSADVLSSHRDLTVRME